MKQDALDLKTAAIGYYMVHGTRLVGRSTRRKKVLETVTERLVVTMGDRTMRRCIRSYAMEVIGMTRIKADTPISDEYVIQIVDQILAYTRWILKSSIDHVMSNDPSAADISRVVRRMARITTMITHYHQSRGYHQMVTHQLTVRQERMK